MLVLCRRITLTLDSLMKAAKEERKRWQDDGVGRCCNARQIRCWILVRPTDNPRCNEVGPWWSSRPTSWNPNAKSIDRSIQDMNDPTPKMTLLLMPHPNNLWPFLHCATVVWSRYQNSFWFCGRESSIVVLLICRGCQDAAARRVLRWVVSWFLVEGVLWVVTSKNCHCPHLFILFSITQGEHNFRRSNRVWSASG